MAVSATTGSGGLDVETLVSQLMALEKRPLKTLDAKLTKNANSAQYIASFKTTVTSFEASLAALRDSSRISGLTATSSDAAAVTATASSGAAASDIDVKVVTTAQSDRVAFSGLSSATDLTGSGTFSLVVGGKQVNIALDSSSTYSDLVTKINAAASSGNVPLKASLVQTASSSSTPAWSMVVAGTETGSVNTISAPADISNPVSNTLLQQANVTSLQSARDAVVIVDGLQVTSASNKIDNVIPGVMLQLRKPVNTTALNATSVQISVASNTADIHGVANTVVTSFNALQDYYISLTKTSIDPTQRGPMSGDSSLAAMMSQTRSLLASGMTNLTGSTTLRFADMGIELKSDGHLTLNETNFATALTNGLATKLAAGVIIPLDTYLGKMVLSSGTLGAKAASLTTEKATLQKTRDDLSDRLTLVEASLRARYSTLDATLYRLNNINTSLTSSLKALSNNNGN